MPFTTALKPFPRLPSEQAPIAQPSLLPSTHITTFLTGLRDWASTITAGLGESGATSFTVATLPTAVGKTGVRYMVTDATATTFMSTVAGGGANIVPVFSNGTVWKIG
jgi:hypothetical protein